MLDAMTEFGLAKLEVTLSGMSSTLYSCTGNQICLPDQLDPLRQTRFNLGNLVSCRDDEIAFSLIDLKKDRVGTWRTPKELFFKIFGVNLSTAPHRDSAPPQR